MSINKHSKVGTARTTQQEQDEDSIKGHLERDRQDKQNGTDRTEQTEQDRQNRITKRDI
jgi:hypothetical protein